MQTKLDYVGPGGAPDPKELAEITRLIAVVLALPDFAGQPPHIVLNALCSAHWTAAHTFGQQLQAAYGMVQIGTSYLEAWAALQQCQAGAGAPPVRH